MQIKMYLMYGSYLNLEIFAHVKNTFVLDQIYLI